MLTRQGLEQVFLGVMVLVIWGLWGLPACADHRTDLSAISDRILGGAFLLRRLEPTYTIEDFYEKAHHFQRAVRTWRAGGSHLRRNFTELEEVFRNIRYSYSRRSQDNEVEFILTHLREDVEAAGRLVGQVRRSSLSPALYSYGFIQGEVCVGENSAGPRPCPKPKAVLTFPLPREASAITQVLGEWRDYGLPAKAQVILNGVSVWQTDVKKKWDQDARALNFPVSPRSTLTIRSANGDPIWIRRLEIQYTRGSTRALR